MENKAQAKIYKRTAKQRYTHPQSRVESSCLSENRRDTPKFYLSDNIQNFPGRKCPQASFCENQILCQSCDIGDSECFFLVKQSSHTSVVGILYMSLNPVTFKLIFFLLVDLVQAYAGGFVHLIKQISMSGHVHESGSPSSQVLFFFLLESPPISWIISLFIIAPNWKQDHYFPTTKWII